MRILVVSQYFWPEDFRINELTQSLVENGARVDVLTGKPNYPEGVFRPGYRAWGTQREEHQGVSVFRVPLSPRGRGSALGLLFNYLSFIFSGLIFGPGLLRARAYDAVFVYAPSPLLQALPALWLAHRKNVPCVLWVQDLWPESLSATGFIRNRYALALVEWVVRFIYRHVDRVLVPSEAFRAPIERLGVLSERINYYPNAYVEEHAFPPSSQDEVALAREIAAGFSVVFAGNLGTAQALETVVEAAKLLQEQGSPIRFFLIGSGSRAAWVQEEVVRCGLSNIRLPGRFPNQAMPIFYAAAGALLVSLRDEPIFAYTVPSKVQGYLAAGRPVIASLNGEGARIISEAGAGLVCRAGDAEGLAQAVLQLQANSAEERVAMGAAGRTYYLEYFESGKLAKQLLWLLESIKKQEGS